MKRLVTAVALCLALPAYAQNEITAKDRLSEIMSQQGYVPVSLFMDTMEVCEGLLNDFGDNSGGSRLGMEYCGVMLFSAMSVAMEYRVGGVAPTSPEKIRQNELLVQQVTALRVQLVETQALLDAAQSGENRLALRAQLARALAAKLAAETELQDANNLNAALKEKITLLEADQ